MLDFDRFSQLMYVPTLGSITALDPIPFPSIQPECWASYIELGFGSCNLLSFGSSFASSFSYMHKEKDMSHESQQKAESVIASPDSAISKGRHQVPAIPSGLRLFPSRVIPSPKLLSHTTQPHIYELL
jgi:hypothetical protein